MSVFLIVLVVALTICLVIAVASGYEMAATGFVEGRRAALKDSIEYCRSRQDVAVYMAPEGELTVALLRARAIHDVEMELRSQLALTPVRK